MDNTRSKYIITDSLCSQTGSADTPMDGIKLIYKQLRASGYIKDARSLSVLGDDGVYCPLGSYQLNSGHIQWSVGIVKHWRNFEKAAGRDCFLNIYYKELDICPKCKGNKGDLQYVGVDVGYMVTKACPACRGNGKYHEPTIQKFNLIVREQIYRDSGEGSRTVDMVLDSGSLTQCIKCFKEIRGSYNDESQFRVEDSTGKIFGIQVKGEILWLPNVPPPAYFVPPKKAEVIALPHTPASSAEATVCLAGYEGYSHD